jgi:V8-like Glu-specific endopeptidase
VGRLITPMFTSQSVCTAVLVGKRHILTASQCAFWSNMKDDSGPGPMFFQPGYNRGPIYPVAKVKYSYWLQKWDSTSIQDDTGGNWLVGILDRDMQASNGFFGLQLYKQQWGGLDMWNMLGYPNDIDPAIRQQMYQGPMSVIDTTNAEYGEIYSLEGYSQQGDTGAAVFGMFQNIPRVIGVNSGAAADNSFEMLVHGGPHMVALVAKAVAENP